MAHGLKQSEGVHNSVREHQSPVGACKNPIQFFKKTIILHITQCIYRFYPSKALQLDLGDG
jgi:hypothetical protein